MGRYTQASEPWKDPPLEGPPRRHAHQDPFLLHRDLPGDQSTEFSFGPGPVAPHLNGETPENGGIYIGKAPRVDPPASGVGRPKQHSSRHKEARGNPGQRIAR